MRRLAFSLLLPPLLLAAASAPIASAVQPADRGVARARAEAAAAAAEAQRLDRAAAQATGEAARLRAEQDAAAAAILSSEAQIAAADARFRQLAGRAAQRRAMLEQRQAPAAQLVAGLAMMARNPPLLALAAGGSTDDFIRVRALLDSTLPAIRARTAALAGDVAAGERLTREAAAARADLARGQADLAQRQRRFAALESEARARAGAFAGQALGAGDVALALGEEVDAGERLVAERQSAARLASELARFGPPPPRPLLPAGRAEQPPIAYQLPLAGRVLAGLGDVGPEGIRARGLTFAAARGARIAVPADGRIAFAGPFRRFDGIVIIDHGAGWTTLLTNVRTALSRGSRVRRGDPLGVALGDVGVELSHNGRWVSAALIAGSAAPLSNSREGG